MTDQFQAKVDALLQKHFGMSINDTRLCETECAEKCLADGVRPFEAINEVAERYELGRIDKQLDYGNLSCAPLTAADEEAIELPEPRSRRFSPA